MSKANRMAGLRRRIARLQARISADQAELSELKRKSSFMAAKMAVEAMPESQRTALGFASMSTNLEPRPPVIRD